MHRIQCANAEPHRRDLAMADPHIRVDLALLRLDFAAGEKIDQRCSSQRR